MFRWLKQHKKEITLFGFMLLVLQICVFVPLVAIAGRSLFLLIFSSVLGSILIVVAAIYLVKVLGE